MDSILYWNAVAIEVDRVAHTKIDPLEAGSRGRRRRRDRRRRARDPERAVPGTEGDLGALKTNAVGEKNLTPALPRLPLRSCRSDRSGRHPERAVPLRADRWHRGVDGFRINPDGTLTQILTLSGLDGLEGVAAT